MVSLPKHWLLSAQRRISPSDLKAAYLSGNLTSIELAAAWKRASKARREHDRSEELKAQKAQEQKDRLERDLQFLLAKALEESNRAGYSVPARHALAIDDEGDVEASVLDTIHAELARRPYLRHVAAQTAGFLQLWTSQDGLVWKQWGRYEKWERKHLIALRAKATDAFGEDPMDHWGRVRGRLLERLKDPKLDTLQREDVKLRLAEARSRGVEFVVIGKIGFFWDSSSNDWQRREVERADVQGGGATGSRLWREGRIISNNHGRVVVLPFIKEDGTKTEGHTRNAPYQGPAEPRPESIEIPFAIYDDLNRDETWEPSGSVFMPAP